MEWIEWRITFFLEGKTAGASVSPAHRDREHCWNVSSCALADKIFCADIRSKILEIQYDKKKTSADLFIRKPLIKI